MIGWLQQKVYDNSIPLDQSLVALAEYSADTVEVLSKTDFTLRRGGGGGGGYTSVELMNVRFIWLF